MTPADRRIALTQLAQQIAAVLGPEFTGRVTINVRDGRLGDIEIGERIR